MSIKIGFGTDECDSSGIGHAKRGTEESDAGHEEIVFTPEDLAAQRTYLLKVASRILKPELRPKVSASDLVQESVIVAIRKFRSFQGQSLSQLRSWLTRILKHRYGNHHRNHYGVAGKRKRPEVSLESLRGGGATWEIPDQEDSVSAERIREQFELVRAEMARLSAAEAEVFTLVIGQQLTIPEIAGQLGISEATARKRYMRAKKRIRKRLKRYID